MRLNKTLQPKRNVLFHHHQIFSAFLAGFIGCTALYCIYTGINNYKKAEVDMLQSFSSMAFHTYTWCIKMYPWYTHYSLERVSSWNLVGSYFWGPNANFNTVHTLSSHIMLSGKEREWALIMLSGEEERVSTLYHLHLGLKNKTLTTYTL